MEVSVFRCTFICKHFLRIQIEIASIEMGSNQVWRQTTAIKDLLYSY